MIKTSGSALNSHFFFSILQSIKCFEKAQSHHLNRHPSNSNHPIRRFFIFCASIYHDEAIRWWEYPRGKFFDYKWPSDVAIKSKNSFVTLKACFRCLQCAMAISINTLPQVLLSSLSMTQLIWVTEGKKSWTEPCVSPEFYETSTTCDKEFIIQKIFGRKEIHRYSLLP